MMSLKTIKFISVIILAGSLYVCNCATEQETAALEKLRKLVRDDELNLDYMKTDTYLLAWLRKYKLNIEKTALQLREGLKWRNENQVDKVLEEDFSIFEKMYPYDMSSVDKEGRPVFIYEFGKWDLRRVILSGQSNQFNRYTIFLFEKIASRIREANEKSVSKNITQYVFLADLAGFNLRQHGCIRCISLQNQFNKKAEESYPDTVFKVFLINTSTIFDRFFRTVKSLISESELQLIDIYDFDRERWSKAVLEYIDEDQLTPQFGGTKQIHSPK